MAMWRTGLLVIALAASTLVGGCGGSTDSGGSARGSGSGSGSTRVTVVASTDVYGDIVKDIAGDRAGSAVTITSIINDPGADPHSYEADPQNQLALSRADVVIENGGGYDDFVGRMLSASKSKAAVVNAVDIAGVKAPAGGELNEHVWYDFPAMEKLVMRLEGALAKADPAGATTYAKNTRAFIAKLHGFESIEAGIKKKYAGTGVAITEPVPVYLLDASGLVVKTPAPFSEAVEEGTDVSVRVLRQTEQQFADHEVKLLAYNEQTTGAETRAVLRAAASAGVPVVPVTETLPKGKTYLTWMAGNLAAVAKALR